jgi:transposase
MMTTRRTAMRKIEDILRLKLGLGLSDRAAAESVEVSPTTVGDCVLRAKALGLCWPLPEELDEARLEAMLYPPPKPSGQARHVPDWAEVQRELSRKGVTLELVWREYKAAHPEDGYQYSQFCELYREYRSGLDVVMRQPHRAGEKLFVDFSGDGIPIVDQETGEVTEAELFVGVLGASNYTYAELTSSQGLHDWVMAHIHAYEYFDGVPAVTVPDNLKAGVKHPSYYEPELNPTYQDLAKHYGTAVIPARPKKPRDKAKVENGVLVVQRWIIAALRNEVFTSFERASEAVKEKLVELNDRKLQGMNSSRKELFLSIDHPALKPLPRSRYEFAEWTRHLLGSDYHIKLDMHHYSAPHNLTQHRVESRMTATTVEVFHKGRRVASHQRVFNDEGGYSTQPEHMPEHHRRMLEWTPSRVLEWAASVGPATTCLAKRILEERPHIEQGCRACLGLSRLETTVGKTRLEAASARALAIGSPSYKSVKSILDHQLENHPLYDPKSTEEHPPIDHENIRGPEYYN